MKASSPLDVLSPATAMMKDQEEMGGLEGTVDMMDSYPPRQLLDRRLKPQADQEILKCPRCDSTNTKFCYYNNYSLTQPRHFCKTCRRYWTKGGSLRSVPVGGGCRKNSKRNTNTNNNGKRSSGEACSSATGSDQLSPSLGGVSSDCKYYNGDGEELIGINYVNSLRQVDHEAAFAGCSINSGVYGIPANDHQSSQSFQPYHLPTALHSLQGSLILGSDQAHNGFNQVASRGDLGLVQQQAGGAVSYDREAYHPYLNMSLDQSDGHSRAPQQHKSNNMIENPPQGLVYEGGYWNGGVWPDLSAYGLSNINPNSI